MTCGRGFSVLCACLLATFGLAVAVQAEALPREQVPEPLKPWIDWALRGHEQELCPYFDGAADRSQCAWPARLTLDLDEKSGRFTQQWRVYSDAWIPLPGDARRWPVDVRVDGKPAPAVVHDGAPAVRVSKGKHDVGGSFAWSELPELLPIPAETGLVGLSLGGKPVPFPRRDPQGQLWLKSRPSTVAEEARLDVRVYRRVVDDVPLELTTRVELRVSGNNREVVLGRALPDGFVAMALDSPLPARLESDGHLRVQVRPGTWTIELRARHLGAGRDARHACRRTVPGRLRRSGCSTRAASFASCPSKACRRSIPSRPSSPPSGGGCRRIRCVPAASCASSRSVAATPSPHPTS